ncbi:MAG TPA: PilZ domain-containing protein [Candidatus Xenobia bacterium]|jgi:c-di-GMP-binding flagellar brake protein YcgR
MLGSLREFFNQPDDTRMTQRRRHRRFSCFVPILITHGKKTEPATVVDMATEGLRLRSKMALKANATVKLHYAHDDREKDQPVTATVIWCRPSGTTHEIGVVCKSGQIFWVPVLLRMLAASTDGAEVRQTVRIDTRLDASMSIHFGASYASSFIKGQLADLSLGGAAFYGPATATVGTMVQIRVDPTRGRTLTIPGQVVRLSRSSDGRTLHGIKFTDLPAATRRELSHLLCSLRVDARKRR